MALLKAALLLAALLPGAASFDSDDLPKSLRHGHHKKHRTHHHKHQTGTLFHHGTAKLSLTGRAAVAKINGDQAVREASVVKEEPEAEAQEETTEDAQVEATDSQEDERQADKKDEVSADRIKVEIDTAKKKEVQIQQLKSRMETQSKLISQGSELLDSFQDDPSQSESIKEQLKQNQDMLQKDQELMDSSKKVAAEASARALEESKAMHEAALAAEKKAEEEKKKSAELEKKATELKKEAEEELEKVHAAAHEGGAKQPAKLALATAKVKTTIAGAKRAVVQVLPPKSHQKHEGPGSKQ